ncbi:MAG: FecR domain-containing protein [Spirochaetaceae bacterium]|nr:FecR domain-containing protein [Spirochaetaceae bacterium]
MKKKTVVLLFLLAVLASPLFAQDAVIREVSGKVEFRLGSGAWRAVTVGRQLALNATISTGFGASAVIRIGEGANGSVLEVGQLTRLTLEELVQREGTLSTSVFVPVGRVRATVSTAQGRSADFRVRGPLSTAAVRGTGFETNGWQLSVTEGIVEFVNALGEGREISPGQISVTTGGAPSDPADELNRRADIGDGRGPSDFGDGQRSSGYITVKWQ